LSATASSHKQHSPIIFCFEVMDVRTGSHSKKRAILMALILGFASEPAEARKFATQTVRCSKKARITEKAECQEATDALKDIKTTKNSFKGVGEKKQLYPNGMGTVGEGNIEENRYLYYPDCSYHFAYFREHFQFCPAGMDCEVNSLSQRKNEAVCKAFCDETKPICPMGKSLRKDAATTRGSEAEECCESDSALQNLDTASEIIECLKREKTYSGFVSCATTFSVESKTVANSRLYADNIPSLHSPSAVVPVFAASAAVLAVVAATVSYRCRRHVYHSEASMIDASTAE